jgi:hypothetical protein
LSSAQKGKINKQEALDLVLIIDRSGSMAGTERGIIIGHQTIIDALKKTGKNVTLTTILFDDDIVIECDGKRIRIDEIKKIKYKPGGTTALFDAWGAAINHINERKKDQNNPYPNADVLYLTVTDGEENSSSVFNMTKIRNLMMREKERSIEGRGVREFATVREFGIDYEQFVKDARLGQNKTQTFYRGDAGIDVLFRIIELAADNMIQNRQITEQWIEKSDKLKIGSYTLGQLKKMTKEPERVLANIEKTYMELLRMADNGLTREFLAAYTQYGKELKKLELHTGNAEVDSILKLYIEKQGANEKEVLQYAKDKTVEKAAVQSELNLGKIRKIADSKLATDWELYNAINVYNDSVKKFMQVPALDTHLNDTRIVNNISDIIAKQKERYEEIISTAFKLRTELLKNAFGAEDIRTFRSLAWFTREPLFSVIKDFPDYKEFCKWADTLNGEISGGEPSLALARPAEGSASVPKENIFGFLETFSPEQLVPLLKNEAPVIAAAVLSRLPPNVSAETLGKFPLNLKTEILKHIARKSEVFPDVLERVAAVLREKSGLDPRNCPANEHK